MLLRNLVLTFNFFELALSLADSFLCFAQGNTLISQILRQLLDPIIFVLISLFIFAELSLDFGLLGSERFIKASMSKNFSIFLSNFSICIG